jgi:hypothetical protein
MSCSPTTLVEFVDEWILDHACCYKEGSGNTVHKNQCSICFFIIHPSLRSGRLRYVFFFKYSLRETFILSMTMVATVLLLKFILTTRLWHDEKLPLTYLIFDRAVYNSFCWDRLPWHMVYAKVIWTFIKTSATIIWIIVLVRYKLHFVLPNHLSQFIFFLLSLDGIPPIQDFPGLLCSHVVAFFCPRGRASCVSSPRLPAAFPCHSCMETRRNNPSHRALISKASAAFPQFHGK